MSDLVRNPNCWFSDSAAQNVPSMMTASVEVVETTLRSSSGVVDRRDSESSVNFSGLSRKENIEKLKT